MTSRDSRGNAVASILSTRTLRHSDVVLALFVVAIAAMLLIPLPTAMLDLLLVVNLSFAFLLLLTALYIPNALALLTFPSVLLLTTLFRLALNVASTRLILSQGDAGAVIRTFGTLLIGSEIVVGVIIFAILTIVNFIVIAKGSARVSEVAARFALDALPGKQMAIDADLRSGLLTAESAQAKREELRKESQLYGAMDGAMRFVQGDAIAGICIIFTNILGGLYMGVVNGGLSFIEATRTYTVLTVGDGLVHQIPALLISICAGIVVTRVSSGEDTTLGGEVGSQLFQRSGTLLFAGLLLLLIGFTTPLPLLPFLSVGSALVALSYWTTRSQQSAAEEPDSRGEFTPATSGLLPGVLGDDESVEESALQIQLDATVLSRLYTLNAARYRSWWRELQSDFFFETGLRLPELQVLPSDGLSHAAYSISVAGTMVEMGKVPLDSVLLEVNPENVAVFGLEVGREAVHPISLERMVWVAQSPALRRVVDQARIRSYDFFEYIALRIGAFYFEHPEELLTVAEVHTLLRQVEKKYPGMLSDAFGKDGMSVARLTELLQALVREGVSLRDFRSVVEIIATYGAAHPGALTTDEQLDSEEVVTYVRAAKKRHLLERRLSHRRTLKVIAVGDETAAALRGVEITSDRGQLSADPELLRALRDKLALVLDPVQQRGVLPVAVLCSSELRALLGRFLRISRAATGVVTFDELEPGVRVEVVGAW